MPEQTTQDIIDEWENHQRGILNRERENYIETRLATGCKTREEAERIADIGELPPPAPDQ
jgi:hypothetical protein